MFGVPPSPCQLSRSKDFKGHFLAEINTGARCRGEKHGLVEWKRKLCFPSKRHPDPSQRKQPLAWRTNTQKAEDKAWGVCAVMTCTSTLVCFNVEWGRTWEILCARATLVPEKCFIS